MLNTTLKSNRSAANRNIFTGLMLLATIILATHQGDVQAASISHTADFALTAPGFTPGVKYQSWTNALNGGVIQAVTGPPQVTGIGTPAYTGVLTAAPFISTGPVINNNQNFPVGSPTPISSTPPYYLPHGTDTNNLTIQWDGYYKAPLDGDYQFNTTSDDGSLMYIGNTQVVNNNAPQGATTRSGPNITLTAGFHKITIMWAQGNGQYYMNAASLQPVASGGGPTTSVAIDGSLFLRRMPAPTITPVSGNYTGVSIQVQIATSYTAQNGFPAGAPPGAGIYYTTDGTTPTTGSNRYGGPFLVTLPQTVTAITAGPGYDDSVPTSQTYTQTPAPDPTFTPGDATIFTGSQSVSISSNAPNAFIYYTLDGSIPTLQNYTGVGPSTLTLTVNATTTIQAFAVAYGYGKSSVVTATYYRSDTTPTVFSCLASAVNNQVNVAFGSLGGIAPVQMDPATANTASNYTISNGVTVSAAALDATDLKTVRLSTSALTPNVAYTLTVKNVKDSTGNSVGTVTVPFKYFNGGGLLYERWDNIVGADINSLVAPTGVQTPLFPDFPSPSIDDPPGGELLTTWAEPSNTGLVNYGSRTSGYFIAPASGNIQFATVADDSAKLSISSDDNPSNKGFATARVTSGQQDGQWNYDPSNENKTPVINLTLGQRYYVELLHKQDVSQDNASVAYVYPAATFVDFTTPPVSATAPGNIVQLSPAIDFLRIVKQPLSQAATQNQSVTLVFDVAGSAPRTVQWSRDIGDGRGQVDIPGANFGIYTIPNVNSSTAGAYQCRQSNLITTTPIYSNLAIVTLVDTVPATLVSISPNLATLSGITNYPTTGGNQAVVTGTHFIPGTSVSINGKICTNISTTTTTLVVTIPVSPKGSYDVVVTKPGSAPLTLPLGFTYDDVPVANAQTLNVLEDTPTAPGAALTATDPTDKLVSFRIVTPPTKGKVVFTGAVTNTPATKPFTGSQSFTYTPNPDQNNATAPVGADTFTFVANDGLFDSPPATVTINISPVNDAPTISNPGNQNVNEDVPVALVFTGIAPGPLTATDEASQTVTLTVTQTAGDPNITKAQTVAMAQTLAITQPVSGSATLSFIPAFPGDFTLLVTATDSGGAAKTVTINVHVVSANDPPTINNPGNQVGTSDAPAGIVLTGIAGSPPNNPDELAQNSLVTLSVTSSDPTYFTSLTFSPIIYSGTPAMGTSTLSYTPAFAKHGPVTLTVTADDHQGSNNKTSVSFVLNLAAINHAPTAVADTYFPTINKPFSVPAPGVLSNDTDPDDNPVLTVAAVPAPTSTSNGTLVLKSDGSFVYTPNMDFTGNDTFTYAVTDGMLTSAPVTVTLTVGLNKPPVATDQTITVVEDTPYTGALPVTDPNFDQLTYTIVTQPTQGTLTVTATGSYTYTPNKDVNGTDSFTFQANDGQYDSNIGKITINITPVNDAPVAVPQTVFVGVNHSIVITLTSTDVEGDATTFIITTPPVNGTLGPITVAGPNSANVTYTPKPGYVGSDSFQFTAKDATLTSTPGTVSITVTPPPVFSTPPTITPNPPFAGTPFTGQASATVVNGTATITWDFGDGTVVTGESVTHTYPNSGQYTITVIATSPEGVSSAPYTLTVEVGLGISGTVPPGAFQPGIFGFLVGGDGLIAGCKAALAVNFASPSKTSFSGTVAGIAFPKTLNQGQLVNQTGMLTIGQGPLAQQFVFTLAKNGRGKATGLPTMQVTLLKGTFSFKSTGRAELTPVFTDIISKSMIQANGHAIINVPVSVQIGSSIYLAMTFQLDYTQTSKIGKGVLLVPAGRKRR